MNTQSHNMALNKDKDMNKIPQKYMTLLNNQDPVTEMTFTPELYVAECERLGYKLAYNEPEVLCLYYPQDDGPLPHWPDLYGRAYKGEIMSYLKERYVLAEL